MYSSRLNEGSPTVSFKLPWDRNAFRGWVLSLIIFGVGLVIFDQFAIINQPQKRTLKTLPPYIAINIGNGDGPGGQRGNAEEEGKANKGLAPETNLHNAESATSGSQKKNVSTNDLSEASNLIVKTKIDTEKNTTRDGESNKNVGDENKELDLFANPGIGQEGNGRGLGAGLDDIDWGSGGNRAVLTKHVPKFPNGVRTSSRIVLQFKVLPDGTVSSVTPVQKADPELERAAIAALKKWRFSRLPDGNNEIQTGRIPITFVLR